MSHRLPWPVASSNEHCQSTLGTTVGVVFVGSSVVDVVVVLGVVLVV